MNFYGLYGSELISDKAHISSIKYSKLSTSVISFNLPDSLMNFYDLYGSEMPSAIDQ